MDENTPKDPRLSNKFYDQLKFIALILLPALGAAYFSLSQIWGLPKPGEVVGTITVIDTFLGVVLKLNSNTYKNSDAQYDGVMAVIPKEDGGLKYDLRLNGSAEELKDQRAVSFKVETGLPVKSAE